MIVKLDPVSEDCLLWKVSVPRDGCDVAVDYTCIGAERRSFIGDGGYFEAVPEAEGWRIIRPAGETPSASED